MTNDTIKRGIRKALAEKEIDIDRIQFSKVKKEGNEVKDIGKITLSLNSIDGVQLDWLKSTFDEYLETNNISYSGIYLDI